MSSRFANSRNEANIHGGADESSYRKLQDDLDRHYHEWVTVPTQRYISERKEEEAFAHQRRQKLL